MSTPRLHRRDDRGDPVISSSVATYGGPADSRRSPVYGSKRHTGRAGLRGSERVPAGTARRANSGSDPSWSCSPRVSSFKMRSDLPKALALSGSRLDPNTTSAMRRQISTSEPPGSSILSLQRPSGKYRNFARGGQPGCSSESSSQDPANKPAGRPAIKMVPSTGAVAGCQKTPRNGSSYRPAPTPRTAHGQAGVNVVVLSCAMPSSWLVLSCFGRTPNSNRTFQGRPGSPRPDWQLSALHLKKAGWPTGGHTSLVVTGLGLGELLSDRWRV